MLTGYPPMALLEDGKLRVPGQPHAGMNVLPDFFLSEAKAREGNTAAERLNGVMEDAAGNINWSFADSHRAAFRGRGLCSGIAVGAWTIADEIASRAR